MIRACLSGSEACTGIAPCDACAKAIASKVLPKAMVAGGFNGSVQIAQRFFEAFIQASDELRDQAPHLMAEAMKGVAPSPPPETPQEPQEEEEEEETSLTEDEVSTMGEIQDTVEDEKEHPARFSRKNAKVMARMARAIKKKRAAQRKKEQEGTHG